MIRFPKMHIAQSVVNRILNVAEDIDHQRTSEPLPPPMVSPEAVALKGAALDTQLFTPPQGPMPPIEQTPEVATGKPALAALIEGQAK